MYHLKLLLSSSVVRHHDNDSNLCLWNWTLAARSLQLTSGKRFYYFSITNKFMLQINWIIKIGNKLRHMYLICSYTGVVCAFSRLAVYIIDCEFLNATLCWKVFSWFSSEQAVGSEYKCAFSSNKHYCDNSIGHNSWVEDKSDCWTTTFIFSLLWCLVC